MTEIDFAQLGTYERYKLMASLIVPRPIALVTTLGADGTINAAPFSMFNMMGEDPPVVMLSVNKLQDTAQKTLPPTSCATKSLWCTSPTKPWPPPCTAAATAWPPTRASWTTRA